MKFNQKEKAILLRREGLTYSEILKQIPVAKSTLSSWLHSAVLSKKQYQRLTEKKLNAIKKGGEARHRQRLYLLEQIRTETEKDIKKLNVKDLWLAGIMLYWAEGTKEKAHTIGAGIAFNNSDPRMIRLFIKWLKEIIQIPDDMLKFEIYLHTTASPEKSLRFWGKILNCNENKIRVYFKKHSVKRTNRKNIGDSYNGLMRVSVRKSSRLNRRISAWVSHICDYWHIS